MSDEYDDQDGTQGSADEGTSFSSGESFTPDPAISNPSLRPKISRREELCARLTNRHGYKQDEIDITFPDTPKGNADMEDFYAKLRAKVSSVDEDSIGYDGIDGSQLPPDLLENRQRDLDARKELERLKNLSAASAQQSQMPEAAQVSPEEFVRDQKDIAELLAKLDDEEEEEEEDSI